MGGWEQQGSQYNVSQLIMSEDLLYTLNLLFQTKHWYIYFIS